MKGQAIVPKQEMLTLIENKREELIQIVLINGFNSSITIQHSKELDTLLNQFNSSLLHKN